jgi:hypothetical protein
VGFNGCSQALFHLRDALLKSWEGCEPNASLRGVQSAMMRMDRCKQLMHDVDA